MGVATQCSNHLQSLSEANPTIGQFLSPCSHGVLVTIEPYSLPQQLQAFLADLVKAEAGTLMVVPPLDAHQLYLSALQQDSTAQHSTTVFDIGPLRHTRTKKTSWGVFVWVWGGGGGEGGLEAQGRAAASICHHHVLKQHVYRTRAIGGTQVCRSSSILSYCLVYLAALPVHHRVRNAARSGCCGQP
jgi:hypothetical protein